MEFFGRLCLIDNGRIVKSAPTADKGLLDDIKAVFKVSDERFIK
jgi:glutamate/tyrosine decarboxylase-like PLP-dependent enzyme